MTILPNILTKRKIIIIEVDKDGIPIGDTSAKWANAIGSITRSTIDIIILNWNLVLDFNKRDIWKSLLILLFNSYYHKSFCLAQMRKRCESYLKFKYSTVEFEKRIRMCR